MATTQTAATRAVIRLIDPGNDAICAQCAKPIKFAAKTKMRQVIANVYEDSVWKRVEHFHEECYTEAGEPCGLASQPSERQTGSAHAT